MRTQDEELMHSKLDEEVDKYLDRFHCWKDGVDEHYIEGFIAGWNAARENK